MVLFAELQRMQFRKLPGSHEEKQGVAEMTIEFRYGSSLSEYHAAMESIREGLDPDTIENLIEDSPAFTDPDSE
jgi:hypothetical protein